MILHWIWFAELKDLSLMDKHRLLERFHDPEELFNSPDSVLEKYGIKEKELHTAQRILHKCNKKGIKLLPITDSAYPFRLRNTSDAPVLLYYKGILPEWESAPYIGVVGTRKASAYGLQIAHQMGNQIASCGGYVVSGGALGVDSAAMQGALEAGLPVVGVLGCGVDVVYPRNNRRLFEMVAQNGCLLSEYPPETEGIPWHFPARNRIISGISNGVLVVEAPKKSGALITAQRALEQGRDVFVVPGNINTAACEGSNALLQDGAIPALSGWDVVGSYEILYPKQVQKHKKTPLYTRESALVKVAQNPVVPEANYPGAGEFEKKPIDNKDFSSYSVLENRHPVLDEGEQAVLAQLTRQPQEPAELIAKLNWPSSKVLSILTMLVIKGLVYKHPGGRFSLK